MNQPIGIGEAAFIANVDRKTIFDAMDSGDLDWKDLGGHQVTIRKWLWEWMCDGRPITVRPEDE